MLRHPVFGKKSLEEDVGFQMELGLSQISSSAFYQLHIGTRQVDFWAGFEVQRP